MGERCEVFLGKETYSPGESIHGRVECHFLTENKIRGIRVRFRGRAKVYWKEGRYSYSAEENYFEMESDLLLGETTFPPGVYSYPFTFDLPAELPSSMEETSGNIKYSALATIDRPWAVDYESKILFTVFSYNDFKNIGGLEKPVVVSEGKTPFSLFDDSGPIKIYVTLPRNGYVPLQMVAFTARVRNSSNVNVQEVRFKIVQGYEFHADKQKRIDDSLEGQEFAIVDSYVSSGSENSWNLELRVPKEMFAGNLNHCNIIKTFWELRGEVCLPFPYRNFTIHVPIILGAAPLA